MNKAFVVDFDGTITEKDVGYSIIKTFAQNGWEKWENLWVENKITTSMRAEMEWDMVHAKPDEILKHVSEFNINPGFKEFCSYTEQSGHRVVVASDGFSFYINPILNKVDAKNVEVSCCNLEYENGWKFSYPNKGGCGQCGNCKRKITEDLKNKGFKVYYIGDGYSDRCGCRNADVIFAKSYLAGFCNNEGIPYIAFDDFSQIIKLLKEGI